jgi:hypothetical protein
MGKDSVKKGQVYENHIAKQYGKRQPMSGASQCSKEDVDGTGDFFEYLFQTKNASGQKSYSIKKTDLLALRRNSFTVSKTGVMFVNFGDKLEIAVIRKEDFDNFVLSMKRLNELEDLNDRNRDKNGSAN